MPLIRPPRAFQRVLAGQLGHPSGFLGGRVAKGLNKGNGATIRAAVNALDLSIGEHVADVGFGGGAGLDLLLAGVGTTGRVHGVDPSTSMVARAGKEYAAAIASGRLILHEAGMESLPLADGSLTAWMSLNTIYFVDDIAASFGEFARVLGPGGRGVLGVGDPELMGSFPFTQYGFRLRPVADVIGALEAAGMVVDRRLSHEGEHPYNLLVCTLRD